MNSEIALWDQISLGLVLLFVALYIFFKIKKMLSTPSDGCGSCSCSSGSCSVRPTGNEDKIQSVSIDKIQKNITVK